MYEVKDLDIIERIMYLMQVKGLTLSAAAQQIENPIVDNDLEIIGRLTRLRDKLTYLSETINNLSRDEAAE